MIEFARAEFADRGYGATSVDVDAVYGLIERPAWFAEAACAGLDIDLFFPERGETTSAAKAVCAGCPVRDECREFGMRERFGVWGGASERERKTLRREQPKPEPAASAPPSKSPVRQWRSTPEARSLYRERRDLICLLYADGMTPTAIGAVANMNPRDVEKELRTAGVARHQERQAS